MRFSKARIWESSTYRGNIQVAEADLSYFTGTVKAWISIWLDLVNNDRTVVTRRADVVNLITLLQELIKRIADVRQGYDASAHRLETSIHQTLRYLGCDPVIKSPVYAPVTMVTGYGQDLVDAIMAPRNNLDSALQKRAQSLQRMYGSKDLDSLKRFLMKQLQVSCLRLLRTATYGDRYLRDCITCLRRYLGVDPLTASDQECVFHLSSALASLLMFKGYSPQALAEMHMTPFRADNEEFLGLRLEDRLGYLFDKCLSDGRAYNVFGRLTPSVDPSYVPHESLKIVSERERDELLAAHGQDEIVRSFFSSGTASYVKKHYPLIGLSGALPDEFSAAGAARVEISNALNVMYILRSTLVNLDETFLVEALPTTSTDQPSVREVNVVREREVLQEALDRQEGEDSSLEIQQPQPGLQRALHWFRKAAISSSDESGLLEAWISLEYLAQALKEGSGETEIGAIQRYFPQLLAMRMVTREVDYLLWCVKSYVPVRDGLPDDYRQLVSDKPEERIRSFMSFVHGNQNRRDAVLSVLGHYPHLVWEAERMTRRLSTEQALSTYLKELKERFEALFYWVYAVRNEIVHSAKMTSMEVPLLRRTFTETLRELYRELVVAMQHDSHLTVEAYLEECRQEYDQVIGQQDAACPVGPEVLLAIKSHFRPQA